MQEPKMKHLMQGAWMLSLAALIAKVLSAVYRVPLQNLVGDTGFYVYQQVYPIYGIGMTFALSGFPVYISKLVAQARQPDAQAVVAHRSIVLLTWLSLVMFAGLYGFAPTIAWAMADRGLTPLIQMVAFMFLVMPVLATGRGYFQGTFDMSKTAISQVVEQVIRVAVILVAAIMATRWHWPVYRMGTVAMSGAIFGGIAAAVTIFPAFHPILKRRFAWPGFGAYWQLLRRFVTEGGNIALFAAMLIILQLVDSFTVTRGLVNSGVTEAAARSLKGVYDRGQPLVQLGLVVATALSATLLPSMTAALARGQRRRFKAVAAQLIRFNLALSMAATCGLIVLMPDINHLLFGDTSGDLALQCYVVAIALVAMINAYNAILQSRGQFSGTTRTLAIGFVVKLGSNQWLVTRFNTLGASISTVLALAVITVLLAHQVPSEIRRAADAGHFYGKLALCLAAMMAAVALVAWVISGQSRLIAVITALIGVVVGVLVFIAGADLTALFSAKEVLNLPLGRRFLKWRSRHGR
ncbi:polysaccharide biosynthesis protein [Lacticaseibacillus jixiensis]|uniref:polysaccharide biosynthesis protein n=1 Tax=Lacticaseibacillus jixiensis TaxID=3231926 RepID=UPI0036F33ADA